jgi:hypothetical protein
MSKKARSEASERRRKEKRARKAAQRAKYEAWRDAGQNTKSRRVKIRARKARRFRSERHADGPCGNIGCKRCNPVPANLVTPAFLHMS